MRLLFDQNLSPRLVERLTDVYPNASHISVLELDQATDEAVWAYAKMNDYVIVTKDADFGDLSLMHGFPPKVIWLRLGNCTTRQIEVALRSQYPAIMALSVNPEAGILALL